MAVEWAANHLGIGPHDNVHLVSVLPYEPVFGAATAIASTGAGFYGNPSMTSSVENDLIGQHEADKVLLQQLLRRMNARFETVRRNYASQIIRNLTE